MPEIDERVVSMKFDNKSFKNNAQDTLSVLDKLKQKLSFKGASKGLQDIDAAQKKLRFDNMAAAVDNISNKFSAMGAVAFSVINNVVTRAISAGTQIANAFSLAPVMDGFQEYQTNMNSIQTILANTQSKGSTLDDVNRALGELNVYSDKTIYNFAQMARNIGTFTAAGVELDTSVASIKGIANLAAISGSDANQAATAMYQLSQALAAGQVKLMDWNSVVNAGMGGEVFKSALFETGKALGKITDVPMDTTLAEWEDAGNSFRESLSDEWLTSDVLTTTLQAFTGDFNEAQLVAMGYTEKQAAEMKKLGELGVAAATEVKTISQLVDTVKEAVGTGWADSFRIVVGDFEEAKTLLTNINNVASEAIGNWSDARNNLLSGWKYLGGRDALLDGLSSAMSKLKDVFDVVAQAFREWFPAMDGWRLFELTSSFTDFINSLIPTGESLNKIKRIFRGVFGIIRVGVDTVRNIWWVFKEWGATLARLSNGRVLEFFAEIGDRLAVFSNAMVGEGGAVLDFLEKLGTRGSVWIEQLNDKLVNLEIPKVLEDLKVKLQELWDAISGAGNPLEGVSADLSFMDTVVDKLASGVRWLGEQFKKLGEWAGDVISSVTETIKNSDFSFIQGAIGAGVAGGAGLVIKRIYDTMKELDIQAWADRVDELLNNVTGTLEAMQTKLKSEALFNIAKAIGVLAVSLFILSGIPPDDLAKALTATAVGFGELAATMAVLTKMEMGPRGMAKIQAIGTAMILLGVALIAVAAAVKILGSMDTDELIRGLLGVGALIAGLTVAVNHMPDSGKMISTGIGMMAMAAAILLLAAPVKLLGMMPIEEMMRGMIGVGLLLAGITIAVKNMPDARHMFSTGLGIMAIAVALLILVAPVKLLGDMDPKQMILGLIGIALMLAAIVVAVKNLPAAQMLAAGVGMAVMAVGITIIGMAVKKLGEMEMNVLIQGIIGLAGVLLILVVAAHAIQGALAGVAGILALSAALVIFSLALSAIAGIGAGGIILAIIAIAGVLLIFVVAATAAQAVAPGMIVLGSAMLAFGAGLALVGAGVFLVTAGIALLVQAFISLVNLVRDSPGDIAKALETVFVAVAGILDTVIDAIIEGLKKIIDALPEILSGLGEALQVLIEELRELLPGLADFIGELITEILELLREKVPLLIEVGLELVLALIDGIKNNIGMIVNGAVDILLTFVNTMQQRMGEIVQAGSNLIVAFINGIAANVSNIVGAIFNLITAIVVEIANGHERLVNAGIYLVTVILQGIGSMIGAVVEAGKNLIINIITGMGNAAIDIMNAATNMIVQFLLAIASNFNTLIEGGKDMALKIMEGIADTTISFLDSAFKLLINFLNDLEQVIRDNSAEIRSSVMGIVDAIIDGLTGGLSDRAGEVASSVGDIASGALNVGKSILGINSPSKEFMKIGGSIVEGFALGMKDDSPIRNRASAMSENLIAAFRNTLENIDTLEDIDEFQPTITPVLDLSKVREGAGYIGAILGSSEIAATSADQANIISATQVNEATTADEPQAETREVQFIQNNYSPEALSTGDIYRNTRSQIVLAKEKLS